VTTPFLTTKFFIPHPRHRLVDRPRLFAQLDQGMQTKLTLVCAPAGYGKSTVLSEWILQRFKSPPFPFGNDAQPDHPQVCWLGLDAADDDPNRFLGYLLAALERVQAGVSAEASAMLDAFPAPPLQSILTVFINHIQAVDSSILVVLDDYHFITNRTIHEGMLFFLDHLPANMHVVIATRSDPPIPLARLRARRQLTEIRADDLRFSYKETDDLFNQLMGLGLPPQEMARLGERTEGWIAGLQMAALALNSISQAKQSGTSQFINNFSGSNRYILDYLMEEVLSHQPQDIQDFLLQTSIVESLNGSLCDAVTGNRSWKLAGEGRSSQEILEYLERENLFLIPLDSDRLWYRYHHLFTDLLRARLEKYAPERIATLHLRASEWYEQNQRYAEAVDHALNTRDYDRACRLIEVVAEQRVLTHNGMPLLLGWIQRLPPEITLTQPWLIIVQAWSAMFINDVEKIEPLLAAAEQAIHPVDRPDRHANLKGHIACLRAFIADVHNDVPRTIEMAHQAMEWLPPTDASTRTFAKHMLGRAFFIRGDFSQAITTLAENVRECMEAGVTNIIAPTLSALSKIYRVEGKLRESIEALQEGLAYIEACDPRRVTVAGVAYIGQANVLRAWNDLDGAEKLSRRSLELCEPWVNPSSTCAAYLVLARTLQNQGKLTAAQETLHLAEGSIRGRNPIPEVICDLNAARVGFWLAAGQLSKASQWARERVNKINPVDPYSVPRERDEITLAQVQIAEGNPESALPILEHLAVAAETGGRNGHLIEILKLEALALRAMGDQNRALEMLQKSLAFAEPEGYLRTYLDEGEPIREMLLAYTQVPGAKQAVYAHQLLAAFPTPGLAEPAMARSLNPVEPLTARELDVLRLMAEGCSNSQIAEKLILAEGTVKFYVHAVLGKLGVRNRTQAGIEAKKQKII